MSTTKDCPFCHIQDRVLLQNDLAQAFLSDPRKVAGHFLVTPRRHVEKPWELTKDELLAVFDLLNQLEQKLEGKLGDGFDVRQNYRPFLEQSRLKVDHVHYHLIPRRKFDKIHDVAERFETVLFEKLTDQEADQIRPLL